jgi:hypothetical protein
MSDKEKTSYDDLWKLWEGWPRENKQSLQWGFRRALLHWKMWKNDWEKQEAELVRLREESKELAKALEDILPHAKKDLETIRGGHAIARVQGYIDFAIEALAKHKGGDK